MRAFADLLDTTAAVASGIGPRNLTTTAAVKVALKITDTASDALIDALIPRVTQLIVDHCRLARDAAGTIPAFGRETLRATWYADACGLLRGTDLFLPWRPPVFSLDSIVESDTTLTVSTDYVLISARAGQVRRVSSDVPGEWSTGKIVVVFKAGFDTATSLATNIDKGLEAAAIEQIKAMLHAANRDPAIRSVNAPDIGSESYSVTGGDVMGASVLLPQVRDMLATWRNPAP